MTTPTTSNSFTNSSASGVQPNTTTTMAHCDSCIDPEAGTEGVIILVVNFNHQGITGEFAFPYRTHKDGQHCFPINSKFFPKKSGSN
jgi:hypothetical protein